MSFFPSLSIRSVEMRCDGNYGTDSAFFLSDDEGVYHDDQLEFDTGFGNIIVVDNLPVVPKTKFEKLENVLKKIYSQLGVIKEKGLWMPVDPNTGMTLGYCFIEFNTPQVYFLVLMRREHVFL